MSSYWKSLPRYYCKYCNYWCVDNKINVQRHETSELHLQNVERYLSKRKAEKEHAANREREVKKVIQQAANEARERLINDKFNAYNQNISDINVKKAVNKKNMYMFDRAPPIRVTYDTVASPDEWRAQYDETPKPVVYDPTTGNIPPPPPPMQSAPSAVMYDPTTGNIPPPPPTPAPASAIMYDPTTGNIPPPPPMQEREGEVDQDETKTEAPVKYNFDYESKLTEEDLFGSWKTVSVTKVTEDDLKKRDALYDQAVMKSNKEEKKKGKKVKKVVKPEIEEEDEDEKDAFDTYNPFGGIAIANEESALLAPNKGNNAPRQKVVQEKEELKEKKDEPQPFVSTPINFSFSLKPSTSNLKKEIKPKSSSLSEFFS